jgi:hypothetical protein
MSAVALPGKQPAAQRQQQPVGGKPRRRDQDDEFLAAVKKLTA